MFLLDIPFYRTHRVGDGSEIKSLGHPPEELRQGFGVAGERGGQPLYPLLISVEARLILDSQGLILHAKLSDEVASVRQIGRLNGASLC